MRGSNNAASNSETPNRKTLATWRQHWRDEADAAFLYRTLADSESNPERRDLYRRFAEVEDRHAGLWQELLAEQGIEVGHTRPSLRVRLLEWMARLFGASILLPLLLREEGAGGERVSGTSPPEHH